MKENIMNQVVNKLGGTGWFETKSLVNGQKHLCVRKGNDIIANYASLDEANLILSNNDDKFNLCDKDGNLKDVPKLNLHFGGGGTSMNNNLIIMLIENKGFKFSQDCNGSEQLVVINFIINNKINDKDKVTLIQQFLLNWVCINTIKIIVDVIKEAQQ